LFGLDADFVLILFGSRNLIEIEVRNRPDGLADIVVGDFEVDGLVSSEVDPPLIRVVDIGWVFDVGHHAIDFIAPIKDGWVFDDKQLDLGDYPVEVDVVVHEGELDLVEVGSLLVLHVILVLRLLDLFSLTDLVFSVDLIVRVVIIYAHCDEVVC
jgi:hypothetical protein